MADENLQLQHKLTKKKECGGIHNTLLKKSRFSICCFDPKPEATRTCRSISTQVREFRDLIQKLTSNSCSLTWKEPSSGGIMLRARTSHIFKDCHFNYIMFLNYSIISIYSLKSKILSLFPLYRPVSKTFLKFSFYILSE